MGNGRAVISFSVLTFVRRHQANPMSALRNTQIATAPLTEIAAVSPLPSVQGVIAATRTPLLHGRRLRLSRNRSRKSADSLSMFCAQP